MTNFLLKSFLSTSKVFPPEILCDKIKGCLVGSLVGDCFARPFRLSEEVSLLQVQKYFDKLDGPYFKAPFKPYSSNSALSKCVAESVIANKDFNALDVSKRFVKEFYENQNRDYGSNLQQVFIKLRGSEFQNPFGPAKEQHLGLGSYGNSAATRVAPLALFYYNDHKKMIASVNDMASITNSNQLGINGAVLQSCAIQSALALDPKKVFNAKNYLNELIIGTKEFSVGKDTFDVKEKKYEEQLHLVKKLLENKDPSEFHVVNALGHAKVAIFSVPTAVYCFLRAFNTIPNIDTPNQFRRTIQYAIALGGDTDAIASMAGAIAGAYFGLEAINKSLQLHCEGLSKLLELSEAICCLVYAK